MTRGVIYNRRLATMLLDYSGLRWGSVTPTDCDLFVEFSDRCFILAEVKSAGAPMVGGQRLALERMVRRIGDSGADAFFALAWHSQEVQACGECGASLVTIDAAACAVQSVFRNRPGGWRWRPVDRPMTLREFCDMAREASGF